MIEHEICARSTPNLQDLRPWLRRMHLHSDMPQGIRERTNEAIIMSREFSIWVLYHLLSPRQINPSTTPGLKPGVCTGLILIGAFDPVLKAGVWGRRSIKYRNIDKRNKLASKCPVLPMAG